MTLRQTFVRRLGVVLAVAALAALAPISGLTAAAQSPRWGGGTSTCSTALQGLSSTQGQELATFFASQQANGTAVVQNGTLTLNGADATVNVFAVTTSELAVAHSLSITAPSGSAVIVNVAGSAVQFSGIGLQLNGVVASSVLYNFYQAQTLILQQTDLQGSVLAPWASVSINQQVLYGTLVAASASTVPGTAFVLTSQTSGEAFNTCVLSAEYTQFLQSQQAQQNQQGQQAQQRHVVVVVIVHQHRRRALLIRWCRRHHGDCDDPGRGRHHG